MPHEPRTLMEAVRYFSDPDVALQHMVNLRWPNGVTCPTCGRTDARFIPTRRIWECKEKHAKRQFSAKVGTIFEDSAIPLDKWFVAIWMVANCKNGISSYELARSLGITQKSAWHMNHRIRLAMKLGTIEKMDGEVEADESFIGGLAKNMHPRRRAKAITGTGGAGKTAVLGILQRSRRENPSRIHAHVIPNVQRVTLHAGIRDAVQEGATLYTDRWHGYRQLTGYVHSMIDHAVEYVNGRVHTNGIENFWSLLKRSIKGTYISVEPFHLGRYVDEQVFRFNERNGSDADRFTAALRAVTGKRLTYRELTGNGAIASAA
ncbi:IS1595 family transposase [Sphingosinicella xenopeptidilytica]|uniref:IS1595 family transposase n=1 Tax=Sphingosinicella xenopeptidilytica TaxID=364098 RepID=A0ABW3C6X8_SPHXN